MSRPRPSADRLELDLQEKTVLSLLIVEDDHAEAQRIGRDLEAVEGLEVRLAFASTVEDGLREIEGRQFDAVLLDLTLPDGHGSGVLAQTRAAFSDVPVIVMVSEDDSALALEAVRLGAQGYLAKGRHDTTDLVQAIRHAVARHSRLSELREATEREHFRATHDDLTGLYNRIALEDFMQRCLARAKRYTNKVAVLFLDLDQFKPINDQWGHDLGDRLLTMVAQRLSSVTRDSNMAARVGGDEFVLVLQDFDEDHVPGRVAEILVEMLGAPFVIDGTPHVIGTSVGIALYPQDGDNTGTLFRRADTAMYHAKAKGRNRYHYYADGMDAIAAERLEMESAIRSASGRGELLLHYQPVVDVEHENRVTGATAFLRWRRGDQLLNAAEFLPIAQRIGMLEGIGSWVVQAACEAVAAWDLPATEEFQLAVKATHGQLERRDFVDTIARSLRHHGLDPRRLALEVRQCCVADQRENVTRTLEAVRGLGVKVIIEDFGSGCSALESARDLKVDAVKIAPRLILNAINDEYDRTVVEALTRVAGKLGTVIIATGVETAEQRDLLVGLGCAIQQGNLFSPAVDRETMREALDRLGSPRSADARQPR